MLFARPSQAAHTVLDRNAGVDSAPEEAIWLDLLDPTEEEHAQAAAICGFRVPTREQLSEIESSSRISREGNVLYLSLPLTRRRQKDCRSTPVGFVVAPQRLLTIRFLDYPSFDTYAKSVEAAPSALSAADLLLGLLEAIVDRMADVLEYVGSELDQISARIFHADSTHRSRRRNADTVLRGILRDVGRIGDMLSMLRDSLLGLSRMLLFLDDVIGNGSVPRNRTRLRTLSRDVHSLADFDSQVTNKVQFLLDATLGFINIDQNNGIRVLTVVSIIGIPPTLIASIYGMNFKNIPELNWSFGYFYALGLMVLSVVLPLIWFRMVRWI